jgi:sugar-specific transcriptional regulator TrmB
MKANLLSWLASTGLDAQRAELYLAALGKGEASAIELAEASKLGRTAVYDNLRVLEERGFVRTVQHGKRKVFVALHPKELQKRFDAQREQLKDLLPDFLSLYAGASSAPFVQTFQGPHAAREVLEDILAAAKDEYVYFSPQLHTMQMLDRGYIKKWISRRVAKGIRSRSLRIPGKTVSDPEFSQEKEFNRQIRYLPSYVDLRASIYIYGNNVGIISTHSENAAFIIHSPDLAFSLKHLFEFMWSLGTKS